MQLNPTKMAFYFIPTANFRATEMKHEKQQMAATSTTVIINNHNHHYCSWKNRITMMRSIGKSKNPDWWYQQRWWRWLQFKSTRTSQHIVVIRGQISKRLKVMVHSFQSTSSRSVSTLTNMHIGRAGQNRLRWTWCIKSFISHFVAHYRHMIKSHLIMYETSSKKFH